MFGNAVRRYAVETLALVRRLAVPPLRAAVTDEKPNRAEILELSDEPQAVGMGGP